MQLSAAHPAPLSSDSLEISASVITQCQSTDKDLQEEEEIVTLWGAGNSISAWPQPPTGCSFSLPQHEYPTTLHVEKQLQQMWLDPTSHAAWGNGAFQRGCAYMSQQVEEWFGLRSHISEESPKCWIPKQKNNTGNLCQLLKMCSSAAGMCLNTRHGNPPTWTQFSEFTWKIKISPRTFK